ncbi:(2,3-dihydroxybenzoyl)adenylate synthase [Vibrio campbellii]|uniref:(2,3-dihydroxybenzoyl)adenylate synthase n=1 Tax=Vibrio campbellii TaxID=680 RepID=UPI0009719280|nr:(2,3-dihydroxybenzoyl)adenylate synthase [Vibrio campbellii]APX06897.1 (2,3-dihydroxybenzoyl)adenylate synthase [Vibrio campbellii]ARR07106.1 enterobactin synthase subunit E [Vibrio campbellii]
MSHESMQVSGFTPWPEARAEQYRQAGYWTDQTIPQMLQASAIRLPQQLALVDGEREWTYQSLAQQVDQLAAGFQTKLSLKPGDKAVLHLPNIGEFYLSFFALLKIGVQPVLALPAHRYSEIRYFCHFTEAKVLITAPQRGVNTADIAQQVGAELPSLTSIVWAGEASEMPTGSLTLDSLYSNEAELHEEQGEDFAFFQLSGGTTGTPKLIPRTHSDYLYSVRASNEVCQFSDRTRYLCVLPAAHNFPLSSPGALGCLMAGGTVVLTPDASPQTAFSLIKKYQITVAALVPPLALLWLDEAARTEHDITSLEVLQVGGARFSEEAAKRVRPELGCTLQQVFGMAEGLVNYTRLDDPESEIISTQGRPMSPADELLVLDEMGNPVEQGTEGILFVRGPYTIQGYYRAPEHNQRSFTQQGYYRTGDIVVLTEAGNLQVVGRDKDQINRGGEKIAAEEVENHLLAHDSVHDAAVIAIPDDYLGERSCAALVCPEQNPRVIEIKRFLRDRGLADFKIPDRVIFVDVLPKTPVGKINKNKLLELV